MSASRDYFNDSYPFDAADIDGAAIAETLCATQGVLTWMDLGCGPMLSVWAAFLRSARTVIGLDRLEENVAFLTAQRAARQVLEPHRRALRFASRAGLPELPQSQEAHVLFDRIVEVATWNVLELYPRWHGECDLVTQLGCFGCLESKDEVRLALGHAGQYLRADGRFISVTWIQRTYDGLRAWNGPVSAELSLEWLVNACVESGLNVYRGQTLRTRDPHYDGMVLIEAVRSSGR